MHVLLAVLCYFASFALKAFVEEDVFGHALFLVLFVFEVDEGAVVVQDVAEALALLLLHFHARLDGLVLPLKAVGGLLVGVLGRLSDIAQVSCRLIKPLHLLQILVVTHLHLLLLVSEWHSLLSILVSFHLSMFFQIFSNLISHLLESAVVKLRIIKSLSNKLGNT